LTPARADRISTAQGNGADSELRENGGVGTATATANSTSTTINARWNPAGATPDRNEWIALKFDLSAYADKTAINGVTLNVYTYRADAANNERNLQFYAIRPGTAGEDWDPATTTYATMPGFTFDMDSTTNVLDVGGALVDLGTFNTTPLPNIENEGTLVTIPLATLTANIQEMGSSNVFTVLITYVASSNGQFRIPSEEAAATNTSVLSGAVGDFAAYLDFTVGGAFAAADFTENGTVDGADLGAWTGGFGTATGATHMQGDANADGDADGGDYLVWQEQFNPLPGGAPAGHSIPEPACAALLAVAVLALPRRRRLN
jgi:hypothetical protein